MGTGQRDKFIKVEEGEEEKSSILKHLNVGFIIYSQ
jgi:hypothetical protein